tara:strand:+ start:279 stop:2645 length:2367 start_codon:yes stop_codon:yes gene_type:complete
MATTEHFYTGNGSTTTYAYSFPILQNSDLKVELDNVLKTENTSGTNNDYSISGTNVVFNSAPGSNVEIHIYRLTDVDSPKAVFAAGSSIRASDLNNIVDQALYSAQEQVQTIKTNDLQTSTVTTVKIKDANITEAKLATNSVTTDKIADNAVTMAKLAGGTLPTDISVVGTNITDLSVGTADIANGAITTAKLGADAVDGTKIADDAVDSEHIAADSLDTEHYAPTSIDSTALASNAVTSSKITDANVTTDKIADSNVTLAKLANDLKQTTVTDDDTKLPTSGAIVDYVAGQLSTFGGFTAIANEVSFPNTQPQSGATVSISDAAGLVVNSSGTSTTGRTVGGSTVTINNIPSNFHSSTVTTGVRFIVTSTGSGQIYNYHKATLAESDLVGLSGQINDFSERYRVGSTNPTTNNDAGDLFFNTGSNKLLVYNSSTSSFEETQSVGQFFINTISSSSATGGGSATFNGSAYRFTLSNAGTVAEQHLVSINGVIQKPNSGTSQPSEGFAINGGDIIFASAPASGSDFFIITIGSTVNLNTPSANTVTTGTIASGAVTTAKIADDAVDATKLANTSVTAGSYGSSTSIPSITVDAQGRITAASGNSVNTDVVGDTSPQLGGDLDTNGFEIALDADKSITFDGKGNIEYKSSQFQITNSTGDILIDNNASGGDTKIYTNTDFEVYVDDGDEAIKAIKNGAVELYHNNVKKVETSATGVTVTGTVAATSYTGDGSSLTGVASAVADGCIYENSQTISNNYTISTNKNALSAGPITIANGVTLTIPSGSTYTIV